MKATMSPRLTIALVMAAIVAAFVAFVGTSYGSAQGDCTTCHTKVEAIASNGVHAGVACAKCHAPASILGRSQFGASVLLGMRLKVLDVSGTEASVVSDARCLTCHDLTKTKVVGSAIRIDHAACTVGESCTRCHDAAVHGSEGKSIGSADMFDCLNCHTRQNASVECDTCHEGRLPRDRVKTGTFAVTHGADWKSNHGLGSVRACSACHTDKDCGKCHGSGVPHGPSFGTQHGAVAATGQARCQTCHKQTFCDSCHGMKMPHPSGFKQQHSSVAVTKGRAACLQCHAESDCQTCHRMHVHPGGAIGGSE